MWKTTSSQVGERWTNEGMYRKSRHWSWGQEEEVQSTLLVWRVRGATCGMARQFELGVAEGDLQGLQKHSLPVVRRLKS